jgi:hypothetical protein
MRSIGMAGRPLLVSTSLLPYRYDPGLRWYTRRESNPRHPVCKTSVLPLNYACTKIGPRCWDRTSVSRLSAGRSTTELTEDDGSAAETRTRITRLTAGPTSIRH